MEPASYPARAGVRISFELADVSSKDAAAAITSEKQEIAVSAGGKTFGFPIAELRFVELNGSWDVSGYLFTSPREFIAALTKPASFKVTVGRLSLTLPVTATVRTSAAACGK